MSLISGPINANTRSPSAHKLKLTITKLNNANAQLISLSGMDKIVFSVRCQNIGTSTIKNANHAKKE